MKQFILFRMKETEGITPGSLYDSNRLFSCRTLELPYKDNQEDISCIPTGKYILEKYDSPKHGWIWRFKNVEGRTFIEIHIANEVSELLGCIAVGEELTGNRLILSKIAFDRFMAFTENDSEITITVMQ